MIRQTFDGLDDGFVRRYRAPLAVVWLLRGEHALTGTQVVSLLNHSGSTYEDLARLVTRKQFKRWVRDGVRGAPSVVDVIEACGGPRLLDDVDTLLRVLACDADNLAILCAAWAA